MKIIVAPHQTLRKVAKPVLKFEKRIEKLITNMGQALNSCKEPKGIGLAAPQVNKSLQIIVMKDKKSGSNKVKHFINPKIINTSKDTTFGPDKKHPILEGCLSSPFLYGPVPRYSWIEIEYEILGDNKLIKKQKKLSDFDSRVMEHEIDHLKGILFTDYTLKYDLPIYEEINDRLVELEDKSRLESY